MSRVALNRRQFVRAAGLASAGAVLCLGRSTPAAENTAVLNLEPRPDNPRNSEGAFITLRSRRILFLYTQFYGGGADESPARIVSLHSDDEGRTWSREPQVVVENGAAANVMSD